MTSRRMRRGFSNWLQLSLKRAGYDRPGIVRSSLYDIIPIEVSPQSVCVYSLKFTILLNSLLEISSETTITVTIYVVDLLISSVLSQVTP